MDSGWTRKFKGPEEEFEAAIAALPADDPRQALFIAAAELFAVAIGKNDLPTETILPVSATLALADDGALIEHLTERLHKLVPLPRDLADAVKLLIGQCDEHLQVKAATSALASDAVAALARLDFAEPLDLPADSERLALVPPAVEKFLAAREAQEAARQRFVAAADDPNADTVAVGAALRAARTAMALADEELRALCAPNPAHPVETTPAVTALSEPGPEVVADVAVPPPCSPASVEPPPLEPAALVGSEPPAVPLSEPAVVVSEAGPPLEPDPVDVQEVADLHELSVLPIERYPVPVEAATEPAPAVPAIAANHWDEWVFQAMEAGRIALALQLSHGREAAGAATPASVPSAVLEALHIGSVVWRNWDSSFAEYNVAAAALMDLNEDWRSDPGIAVLSAAGALRPALMSDVARHILGQSRVEGLAAPMHALAQICEQVANVGITDLAGLAAPPNAAEIQRRRRAAETSLRSWLEQASTRTTNFGRASAAWRALVAPDGALGETVTNLLKNPERAASAARELLERLEYAPEDLVAEADLAISARSKLSPIEGAARKRLLALLSDARERIDGFLNAIPASETRPDRHKALRGQVLRALSAAADAVAALPSAQWDVGSAVRIYGDATAALVRVLEGQEDPALVDRANQLMHELALLAHFPLNGRAAVAFDADHIQNVLDLEAAMAGLDGSIPTEVEAFESALRLGNVSAASLLSQSQPDPVRAGERIEAIVEPQRKQLKERARELRLRLDDFQASLSNEDPLPEQLEREMMAFEEDAINRLPREATGDDSINDFPSARTRLDLIAARLAAARAARAADLDTRICVLEQQLGAELPHCRQMLDSGDLATLTEEIAQIERHGYSGKGDRSATPILDAALAIIESMGDSGRLALPALATAARSGARTDHVDFSALPPSERERSAALLSAWLGLRRAMPNTAGRIDHGQFAAPVQAFAEAVGFTGVALRQAKRDQHWIKLTLQTDRLGDRNLCIVPSFGSQANGNYTLLLVAESALNALSNNIMSVPDGAIVLVMGTIPPRMRQQLAIAARNGNRPLAIVDDVAVAALASLPDVGLRAFFDSGLAWGFAEPYSDVSEQTSVEMFFGRDRELRDLARLDGPCLVYGGRQLGKTALLKQIELREHAGDRVAIYCKIQRIGEAEQTSQIWPEIEQRLAQRGVQLGDQPSTADRLQHWVQARPGRSMIIMLDEADAFLENELANGFRQLDRIRSLMNDTNRRVKFIFAGLHNVQRFHLAPNSPLLHFGAPVNVGPLMGSDWEAARRMAIDPMAALGFRFQNANDATYMLSLVGFYPSLMQSFGKTVVREANSKIARREARAPLRIDRELINHCFNRQEFRADVVGKFRKTLELDPRYELITYALWEASRADSGTAGGTRGYPASRIREMADEWWPAGFADTNSLESFAALLDEMEQMGVLAKEGIHYRLRSRRIAAMLGTADEINDRLVDFLQRKRPPVVDPLSSHRRIGGVWSPISLRQESLLKERLEASVSVALIGGVAASGIAEIDDALKAMAADLDWPECRVQRSSVTVDELIRLADAYRREAKPGRPKLILVKHRWPTLAELDRLRGEKLLRDKERPVRIVFAACPLPALLTMLPQRPDVHLLQLGAMSAETLRHWLTRMEIELLPDFMADTQQMLRTVTGGWLNVLEAIKRPPQAQRHDLALLRERAAAAAQACKLADLGLSDALLERARELHDLVGGDAVPVGDLDGLEDVSAVAAQLSVLGVLEAPPNRPRHRQFNSLVHTLLAG
ncbi:MAG: AAA family ATPase [Hyphomonadaceae bacterium]|nr:AAA family ATPase [Hyphomonadaceae bacterium]